MFTDPQLYFVLILFGGALYQAIPPQWYKARVAAIMAISAFAIFIISPYALFLCLFASGLVAVLSNIVSKFSKISHFWIILVIFTIVFLAARSFLKTEDILITLGVSFYFLKSAALLTDSFNQKAPVKTHTIFLMNLFFPVFSAGPLAQWDKFLEGEITRKFEWREIAAGLLRIIMGVFKASYIVGVVIDPYIAQAFSGQVFVLGELSPLGTLSFVMLSFLSLYIGFSGYTDMAIGGGYFFGIRAPENFRSPFMAFNIQEFWKRWHLSLVAITNKYIFSPIVRNTGNIGLAILATFVFMGLWHKLSLTYFIWGVMHALAMYMVLKIGRKKKKNPKLAKLLNSRASKVCGWALTMFYAAWLSAFANTAGLEHSINLTRNLIGL